MVFLKVFFLVVLALIIIFAVVGGIWWLIKNIRDTRRGWRLQNEDDKRKARQEAFRELTEGLPDYYTVGDFKKDGLDSGLSKEAHGR